MKLRDTDLSHQEACRRHAMRRLWHRLGIGLTHAEFDRLCVELRDTAPVARGRAGEPVYAVTLRGREIYAIWSPTADCIATFYPTLAWLRRVAA